SFASTGVPARTTAGTACTSRPISKAASRDICLQLFQVFDDFADRFSEIPGGNEIEDAGMERLHEFFELIKHVVEIQPETEIVHAASAIDLQLQRPEVRAAFKQLCTGHDDQDPKRLAVARLIG